ncbi:auxin-responsive protein SAUR65-like [Humulus lupulus]|uniref:auxin-responsive protein SAUR65-like n=1 Tax=Humulus lupulus TaxID=3486 RepID=UPI002B408632|nr:auxin-responsive protein SAUR65-like [Humulus lupulus]
MDSTKSKSNKIRDIVRLQQILKKWKKMANASKNTATTINTCTSTTSSTAATSSSSSGGGSSKSIKFLKRTLSFQDVSGAASNDVVPKGFLAVCVGKEMKRFVIPTEYLSHQAFGILLREAEEEFGFQQEGVLKIPCHVSIFEKILKLVEEKREVFLFNTNNNHNNDHQFGLISGAGDKDLINGSCSSPSDCELTPRHPQMCR